MEYMYLVRLINSLVTIGRLVWIVYYVVTTELTYDYY